MNRLLPLPRYRVLWLAEKLVALEVCVCVFAARVHDVAIASSCCVYVS